MAAAGIGIQGLECTPTCREMDTSIARSVGASTPRVTYTTLPCIGAEREWEAASVRLPTSAWLVDFPRRPSAAEASAAGLRVAADSPVVVGLPTGGNWLRFYKAGFLNRSTRSH